MAIEYTVLEGGSVVSVAFGDLTDADVIGHAETVTSDERVRAPLRQVFDMREVTSLDSLSGYGLRTTAAKKFADDPEGRCAVVVGSALGKGMARIFSAYAEVQGATVRVLESLDDALTWLEMDDASDRVESAIAEAASDAA